MKGRTPSRHKSPGNFILRSGAAGYGGSLWPRKDVGLLREFFTGEISRDLSRSEVAKGRKDRQNSVVVDNDVWRKTTRKYEYILAYPSFRGRTCWCGTCVVSKESYALFRVIRRQVGRRNMNGTWFMHEIQQLAKNPPKRATFYHRKLYTINYFHITTSPLRNLLSNPKKNTAYEKRQNDLGTKQRSTASRHIVAKVKVPVWQITLPQKAVSASNRIGRVFLIKGPGFLSSGKRTSENHTVRTVKLTSKNSATGSERETETHTADLAEGAQM